jgi:hypothetical protein
MIGIRALGILALLVLAATSVTAYHYDYAPYGGFSTDYAHSRSSESVTSHESEYQSSSYGGCGWRYCHSRDSYNYGRSRDFSFSRTTDYEHASTSSNFGYPAYSYGRDYGSYQYPYYSPGTDYPRDYRPYHNYYEMSFTSPYYNPYRYSRVGAYSGYRPYGY